MENASRMYDSKTVKKMIERQKERYGWEFVFIGANIDAVETARDFGIDEKNAVNYHADAQGTACLYDTVSDAVSEIRMGNKMSDNWGQKLIDDYKKRKKSKN